MDEQVRTACGSGCVRTGRLLAESNMSNGSLSYHLPGHRGACRSCARSIRPGRRRRPLRFLGQGTQHGGLPRPVPRYCPGLGRRTYDRGLPGLPDSPRISLHQHSTSRDRGSVFRSMECAHCSTTTCRWMAGGLSGSTGLGGPGSRRGRTCSREGQQRLLHLDNAKASVLLMLAAPPTKRTKRDPLGSKQD